MPILAESWLRRLVEAGNAYTLAYTSVNETADGKTRRRPYGASPPEIDISLSGVYIYNSIHIYYFRRYTMLGLPIFPCYEVSHMVDPREHYIIVERPLIIIDSGIVDVLYVSQNRNPNSEIQPNIQCSICRRGWGSTPFLVSLNPPSLYWPRKKRQNKSKICCSGFPTNRVL